MYIARASGGGTGKRGTERGEGDEKGGKEETTLYITKAARSFTTQLNSYGKYCFTFSSQLIFCFNALSVSCLDPNN